MICKILFVTSIGIYYYREPDEYSKYSAASDARAVPASSEGVRRLPNGVRTNIFAEVPQYTIIMT